MKKMILSLIVLVAADSFANDEMIARNAECIALNRHSLILVDEIIKAEKEDSELYRRLQTLSEVKNHSDDQQMIAAVYNQDLIGLKDRAISRLDLLNQLCRGRANEAKRALVDFVQMIDAKIQK